MLTGDETADLDYIRRHYGAAFAVTYEAGRTPHEWQADPSYGPSREPIGADSAGGLLIKLRHRAIPAFGDERAYDGCST